MARNNHQGVSKAVEKIMDGRIGGKKHGEQNDRHQHEEDRHVMRGVQEHVFGSVGRFVALFGDDPHLPTGIDGG